MNYITPSVVSMLLILVAFAPATSCKTLVLAGGTIVDVSDYGTSDADVKNGIVVIQDDRIAAVGGRTSTEIPHNATVLDISGKYVLPGLIDGFASLDNQAYANAYLYMGVTSIVGIYGFKFSPLFEGADPGPTVYGFGCVGKWKTTTEGMLEQIGVLASQDVRFLLLQYELTPDQVVLAVEKAHELGMVTVGELGKTSYREAIGCGVDAFLHSGRYSLDLAPPEMRQAVASQPLGPPFRAYRRWLADLDPGGPSVRAYADLLASSSVALMPTLTLTSMDLPVLDNPWKEPVAQIIDPRDLYLPVDKTTGKHDLEPSVKEMLLRLGHNTLRIERQFSAAGAVYLTGSGTDAFGTMPGISLHQELRLLTEIGLTERRAIAAATGNFSQVFGWNEIGQLLPGSRADVLVVEDNPLENIESLKSISMVILGGTVLDRQSLLTGEQH